MSVELLKQKLSECIAIADQLDIDCPVDPVPDPQPDPTPPQDLIPVTFDGSEYYHIDEPLQGYIDSPKGTQIIVFKPELARSEYLIYAGRTVDSYSMGWAANRSYKGMEHFHFYNTRNGLDMNLDVNNGTIQAGQWNVLLKSWDIESGKTRVYHNGISKPYNIMLDKIGDGVVKWSILNQTMIGKGLWPSFSQFKGEVKHIYLNTQEFVDFDIPQNRSIAESYLGDDGSLLTGSQPCLYLANDFTINKGIGNQTFNID